ncbi:MAG: transcriptional repressor [Candidatus Omnitrophica bacterium]|nr:transcriptional repressor [Candidatus Omnitrophota bacterium]
MDLLLKHNIRSTQARAEIAKLIFSLRKRHFSAEDVLRNLRRKNSKASRASTFRTLKLFYEKGILEAIDLGKGFKIYEVSGNDKHHDHLYCLRCGKIIEFEDKNIEKLQDQACRKKSFKAFKHTLRIVGICKECK